MQGFLALLKLGGGRRVRTWKQAVLTVIVAWGLTVSLVAYEQQSILVRALFPQAAAVSVPAAPAAHA